MEYLGSEWIVSGTIVGGKLDSKKAGSRLPSAQKLQHGSEYDFVVPARTLKFFDPGTQQRVPPRDIAWQ